MDKARREPGCTFCQIVDRKLPSTVVREDDHYIAIRDINPQAPTHILILPKHHLANINECEDAEALGRLFQAVKPIAEAERIGRGFRLVVNTGAEAGQSVFHLHIHLLGGRPMRWPPG